MKMKTSILAALAFCLVAAAASAATLKIGSMGAFFRRDPEGIEADLGLIFRLFPVLYERRKQHGGTLSGGEQQMLAIARAIMPCQVGVVNRTKGSKAREPTGRA